MDLLQICKNAKAASGFTADKNAVLLKLADALVAEAGSIIAGNKLDVENARTDGMKESLVDRLLLDEKRIAAIANSVRKTAALPDPVGEVIDGRTIEGGLRLLKKRVPLGVVAIIYENRPNVTVDTFGLCFKAGNCVVLRGSKSAINSNIAIVNVIKNVLIKNGINENVVSLIEDTSRETASELMKMNEYIDVLIPRGGADLIRSCVENSLIPVIETGTGVCHIYVDKSADFDMALNIIENAKTQRPGVCNAVDTVLLHKDIAEKFLPLLEKKIPQVEIRHCDYGVEFLDLILAVKTVSGLSDAIEHINTYSTCHSEAIITEDYANAQEFLDKVDSACVYVNASTRFSDGEVFGLGAELGISTQKMHARGPFALEALTSTKFIIYGNGQTRK